MKESTVLYQSALKLGLCDKYKDNWKGESVESLCEMYKNGIEFCIDNNYPDVDYLTKHFRGKTEQFGIYINEMFGLHAEQDVYILNGESMGKVVNSGFGVTKIYVRHNSVLNLTARDNSITYIDMYDNTELNLFIQDKAKVVVNKYGGFIHGDIEKARVKLHTVQN